MQYDASVIQVFVAEAQELLGQMEDCLLRLESEPADSELINGLFRAAHTIKGSAGMFGLDYIVALTHEAESVLDRVRDGVLTLDDELSALFLMVRDQLLALVDCVASGDAPSDELLSQSNALIARLRPHLGTRADLLSSPVAPQEAQRIQTDETGDEVRTDHWHISLRFGPDTFRNGMDPLSFVRYLNTLGRIVSIVTLTDHLPPAAKFDPESCHLGFEIAFESAASKATIENAFEFVRDDCRIRILPPRSRIADYVQLIRELPEEEMRLGEMLLKCGTLTETELQACLRDQRSSGGTEHKPIGEVLIEQVVVQPPVIEAALEKQQKVKEQKRAEASFVRVEAQKLDYLINLVGELITCSAAADLIAERVGLEDLLEVTSNLTRLVEEVRDSALGLRMVQIGATFNRFQRMVRDVSKEFGKDIHLEISGEDTELDKMVVEKITDPLTHLVRNSMDHGIGTPEERLRLGKTPHGMLKLNAYHDSGSIVIEVSDDGRGLDRDKIRVKAVERGLITLQQAQSMSDEDIYNLIFEPGFSTADKVSDLSGRGVGMDVVRSNIQQLRGTVEIHSTPGAGTTTRIRLPLTLAIIEGFLVGVAGAAYVLPLEMVVECIELTEAEHKQLTDGHYINLRGEVLPYVRLRDLFDVTAEPSLRENVVVVQYGGHKAGLVVDELQGEFQTVIKPLGKVFSLVKGIGGFTILGTGDVALILDVPRLVQQVATSEPRREAVAA